MRGADARKENRSRAARARARTPAHPQGRAGLGGAGRGWAGPGRAGLKAGPHGASPADREGW